MEAEHIGYIVTYFTTVKVFLLQKTRPRSVISSDTENYYTFGYTGHTAEKTTYLDAYIHIQFMHIQYIQMRTYIMTSLHDI